MGIGNNMPHCIFWKLGTSTRAIITTTYIINNKLNIFRCISYLTNDKNSLTIERSEMRDINRMINEIY